MTALVATGVAAGVALARGLRPGQSPLTGMDTQIAPATPNQKVQLWQRC